MLARPLGRIQSLYANNTNSDSCKVDRKVHLDQSFKDLTRKSTNHREGVEHLAKCDAGATQSVCLEKCSLTLMESLSDLIHLRLAKVPTCKISSRMQIA